MGGRRPPFAPFGEHHVDPLGLATCRALARLTRNWVFVHEFGSLFVFGMWAGLAPGTRAIQTPPDGPLEGHHEGEHDFQGTFFRNPKAEVRC